MNATPQIDKSSPDKYGRHKINIDIKFKGQRFREYTGERVALKDWNAKKGIVKPSNPLYLQINESIARTVQVIREVWYEMLKESDLVDAEAFKLRIKQVRFPSKYAAPEKDITIDDAIAKFQKDYVGQYDEEYLTRFNQVKLHISDMCKRPVYISEIGLEFMNEYITYLNTNRGLNDNSININIAKIRRILKYMDVLGYKIQASHTLAGVKTYEADHVFLTPDELERLHNFQFDDPHLQTNAARFLLACYTGFRYSDLIRVSSSLVDWGAYKTFELRQDKTSSAARVALNDYAIEIWEKYKTQLSKPVRPTYIAKYNMKLKDIFRIAGIDSPVTISEIRKGKKIEKTYQKWEVASSHSARHTFAIHSIIRGIDIYTLKEIMGHKTITSTEKYAKIVDNLKHERMMKAWEKVTN